MGDGPKLSTVSRIILLIPIFLCITITVYTVYQYEKCLNPFAECYTIVVDESGQAVNTKANRDDTLDEETRRGEEILKEQLKRQ